MVEAIRSALDSVSELEGVRVLYACESGSRAWGFASEDSDYDVRFVYVHPESWYLSIDQGRDVIESMLPGDLDLSGWELRKALRLLRKSNPPLLEWLASPTVYLEEVEITSKIREAARAFYSPRNCFSHYRSMARTNHRAYLQGETVRTKKYLYVIRPLLACRWIERGVGMVPVPISTLIEGTVDSEELRAAIDDLLAKKAQGFEKDEAPADPVLADFITLELERLETVDIAPTEAPDSALLDTLFRSALR
jgi:predicted nucleotidyltransferase